MKIIEQFEIEIHEDKLVTYLLSTTHRIGNHKAEIFLKIGFSQANWKSLDHAIGKMIELNEVQFHKENEFGKFYRVEGDLVAPSKEMIRLRTA